MKRLLSVITMLVLSAGCNGGSAEIAGDTLDACEQYKPAVDPRETLGWVPEGGKDIDNARNYSLPLKTNGRIKEYLIMVSGDENSAPARSWRYAKNAADNAPDSSESKPWIRVVANDWPLYVYALDDLGRDLILTCAAWQDPPGEVLLDGSCALTGYSGSLYFRYGFYPEDWEAERDQILHNVDVAVDCIEQKLK